MLESLGIIRHIRKSIFEQDRRLVEVWIQGDTHEMRIFIVRRIFG